jgi:hypothetical protein
MVGGSEQVAVIRNELLHGLGNLTLTGYNSSLSNRKFEDKRDHANDKGRHTGFRNGLSLNADLADANAWTADQMRERRQRLAGQAFDLFRLDVRPTR